MKRLLRILGNLNPKFPYGVNGRSRGERTTKSVAAVQATLFAALAFAVGFPSYAAVPKSSGVYLTADAYKNGSLSFQGNCKSKDHKLELHDVLNKSYIDVTHESEKHRYAKSELFGFRACNGRDYRFDSNLEYQIFESRELYIYGHKGERPSRDGVLSGHLLLL
jgi:hypothetical protein